MADRLEPIAACAIPLASEDGNLCRQEQWPKRLAKSMSGPPTSRCYVQQQRTTGSPTGREPYGDTATIVVVGVMPHRGDGKAIHKAKGGRRSAGRTQERVMRRTERP